LQFLHAALDMVVQAQDPCFVYAPRAIPSSETRVHRCVESFIQNSGAIFVHGGFERVRDAQ
jgi:hypothetical protein